MEQRVMEVTLISAHNLKDVSRLGKLRPYTEAWVDPCAKQATPVHKQGGGTNPSWNHTFSFTIPEASFRHRSATLFMHILHKTHIPGGSCFIGSVSLPLHQLLNAPKSPVSYEVSDASGRRQGSIQLHIRLGDKHFSDPSVHQGMPSPVMAYPAFPEKIGEGSQQFPCYPKSSRKLPRGHPALPYLPPVGFELPLFQ